MKQVMKVFVAIVTLLVGAVVLRGAGHSYTGPDNGEWETASNWSNQAVPNLQSADTYTIGNGRTVVYTPLGVPPAVRPKALDWATNTTVTITGQGSSWIQGGGDRSWIKIGDGAGKTGTLNVADGASWSSGTSNTLVVFLGAAGANGFVTIGPGSRLTTEGTLRLMNNSIFRSSGTVSASNVSLQGAGSITLSGGVLSSTILSFDGPATSTGLVTLSGGHLTLSTVNHGGIFGGGATQYINFTPGSNSELRFSNIADAETNITTGKIRFSGSTVPGDGSVFTVSHPTKTATTIRLRESR